MQFRYLLSAAAGLGMLATGSMANAAVVLNNATGPTASYGQIYDFDVIGTAGWVYYGEFGGAAGYEKSGFNDRFSTAVGNISLFATPPANNSAFRSSFRFTDPVVPSGNPGTPPSSNDATTRAASPQGTNSAREVIGTGNYVEFTFNIGVSHEVLSVYTRTQDGSGILTLTQGVTELYNSGVVALPVAPTQTAIGSGIFTFDLSGFTAGDTVTVRWTSSGTASSRAAIQGASTIVVPEPTALGMIVLAGAAGLLRRKR